MSETTRVGSTASPLIAATLAVVVGSMTAFVTPGHAQVRTVYPSPQVLPDSPGSVEISFSKGASSSTLVLTTELGKYVSKVVRARYKSDEPAKIGFALHAALVTHEGKIIGQCASRPVTMVEGEPARFPDVCFDGSIPKNLARLGIKTLTIGGVKWIDDKPVNLGLWNPNAGLWSPNLGIWARENLHESSFVLALTVVPEDPKVAEMFEGRMAGVMLRYPIEHGM